MDQKIDTQLALSLGLSNSNREKTGNLNVGYDGLTDTWELIIRYSNDIEAVAAEYEAEVKILLNGYALIKIKENLIQAFSDKEEVIFMEKPKRLYYSWESAKNASCIREITDYTPNLSGRGVIVGVIDTSVDYTHPYFKRPSGENKIVEIFDQETGRIYDKESIKAENVPIRDVSGHGTCVAGIISQIVPDADIIFVKLGMDDYFNSARLMEAVDYLVKRAIELNHPLAINISIGNNYGAHDGSSLVEGYINSVCDLWKTSVIIGSGNEADKAIHAAGSIYEETVVEELVIGDYEQNLDVQLWKDYSDDFLISIIAPDGAEYGPFRADGSIQRYNIGSTVLYVYYGEPSPYSRNQEIFMEFIADEYIFPGIWEIVISPQKIVYGKYDLWLPAGSYVNDNTGFVKSSPEVTLTIPSTAYKAVTVGAYNHRTLSYASFSGRGYTNSPVSVKPDIVAPGVGIISAAPDGRETAKSGTSIATPFVTSGAALLMEWGIILGNDRYLYGEKLKAYLIKGAKSLPFARVPDNKTGWGTLCVSDSIPE